MEIQCMAHRLVEELQEGQRQKYFGTEERSQKTRLLNQKRQAEYDRRLKEIIANQKLKSMTRREAEDQGQEVDIQLASQQLGPRPISVEDEHDCEFSFANRKVYGGNKDDIDFHIEKKAGRGNLKDFYLEGLRRGVGVHHEGMSKPYRQVVEVLLRMGYLKVVIATGSLALGLNMPCKACVFAGDSLQLTPLMFRQMSGRAGRRGFDSLGYVVFWDIPDSRLHKLITSPIQYLTGESPPSATVVLRALQLFQCRVSLSAEGDDLNVLQRQLTKIVSCSLCGVDEEGGVETQTRSKLRRDRLLKQIEYHCRFHLDFLLREGLIDKYGSIQGLGTLCALLYNLDPSNLLIHRLILSGAIETYIGYIDGDDNKDIEFLVILAHVLHRRFFPRSIFEHLSNVDSKRSRPHHSPILPPLPPPIHKAVLLFDKAVLFNLQETLRSCSRDKVVYDDELALPFTDSTPVSSAKSIDTSTFTTNIIDKNCANVTTRSPYACISGRGDTYTSHVELCVCSRRIHHMGFDGLNNVFGSTGKYDHIVINSYIVDFYKHGKLSLLASENGLHPTEAWHLVNDFRNSISDIMRGLTYLKSRFPMDPYSGNRSSDILVASLKRIHGVLTKKQEKENA
eukprot:GHVR01062484.1.p1 GENE.GHVR01062484.1~~GHVR01062484.1.p1  ORF type:complete len:687 (-),score=151.56 GHVR01062484.1:156-2021(-)